MKSAWQFILTDAEGAVTGYVEAVDPRDALTMALTWMAVGNSEALH
jgi:hypothetical protein